MVVESMSNERGEKEKKNEVAKVGQGKGRKRERGLIIYLFSKETLLLLPLPFWQEPRTLYCVPGTGSGTWSH